MSNWKPDRERYEPVGRFSDAPRDRIPVSRRPVYTLRIRPEPGINDTRALRWAVKVMLRRFGFRCVDYCRNPPMGQGDVRAP